jgi:iron complex outermembrane receptor protein/vitamin B12 transporter
MKRSKGVAGWLLVCAGSAAAGAAWARDATPAPAPSPSPAMAPRFFETATVTARPVAAGARSVSVVERDELEASGARSLADVLDGVPGVFVLRGGGRAAPATAQVRAGDPNFTLVLLDGVPLNDPTDTQGGAANLAALPVDGVERVEVVRGPVSAFYGSNGLAGAVQLFTRAGPDAGEGTHARAALAGGNASLLRATATVGMPLRAGRAFVVATREQEDRRVGDDRFRLWSVQGGASFGLGAAALRLRGRAAELGARDYPDASGGPRYGSGDLRRSDGREQNLSVEVDLGSAERRHTLSAALTRHALERDGPGVVPLVPPALEDTRYARWRLGWRAPLVAGARARLAAGVTLERERARADTRLRLPEEFGGEVPGRYDVARTAGGPFVEAFVSRGALGVEAGLRLDLAGGTRAQWSPRLGVSLHPGAGHTRLHASLGRAFKLPGFFALSSPPELGGNPGLRPETAWAAETGVTHAWGARAEAGATFFANRYRNLIDFDFERFTHLNRSRVRARGAEARLRLRPERRLRLEGALTWQQAEEADGVPLLQRPRWLGHVSLTWEPAPAWRVRVDGQGVSRALDRQIPVPVRGSVAGRALVGCGASWRRPRGPGGWELFMRLDNLADTRYETLIGFPGPRRAWTAGVAYGRP